MAANTTADVNWNGKEVYAKAFQRMFVNSHAVGMMLHKATVKTLSRTQPVKRLPSGQLVGLNPSKPNTPPKQVHGQLKGSADYRVEVEKSTGSLVVWFGTHTNYGKALEYGSGKLAARPYLRPTLAKNRKKAYTMFAKGLFKR